VRECADVRAVEQFRRRVEIGQHQRPVLSTPSDSGVVPSALRKGPSNSQCRPEIVVCWAWMLSEAQSTNDERDHRSSAMG
jgi:hypothetical protein